MIALAIVGVLITAMVGCGMVLLVPRGTVEEDARDDVPTEEPTRAERDEASAVVA